MYTVSEDRPRGTSAGKSSREFPVLFHLMDVSRPRAKQSPTIDSANLLNAVEQLRWPPADDTDLSSAAKAASEPVATNVEAPATPDTEPIVAQAIASEPEIAAVTENAPDSEPLEAAVSAATETSANTERPNPPPPSPSLVTLRKKPKTSASEDWFASHGKYIAVAFVLALVATIYFARVNRERNSIAKQETTTKQDSTSQPPLIDTTPAVATTSRPADSSPTAVPTVQTASAAAPATPSPVELRAPQLVEQSSDKSKDNLFEFAAAKNAADRIAARPDDPSKSTTPALTAPAQPTAPEVVATPAPQPATAASPAEAAAYPVTSSPATQYPVSIPPAASYPATSPAQPSAPVLAPPGGASYQPQPQFAPPTAPTGAPPIDYRSQYPVTPASLPPQQPAAQAWNAGQPASYPSYDSTARGPRNERTGSGTY